MILNKIRSKTTERPSTLDGIALARYKFASSFVQNKEVLDIGTGLGAGAHYLAQKGAKKVLGIDCYKPAIEYAKKTFSLENLHFMAMDALEVLSLQRHFDIIVAFEVIEHLPLGSYSSFISKVKNLLNPNGLCLISTPNKVIFSPNRIKPYNPYHIREFTPKEFSNLVKKHFPTVKLLGIKCINEKFLEKDKIIKRKLGNQLATFLSTYKITHELLHFIPKQLRQFITSKDQLPILNASDFKMLNQNIHNCKGLLALCQK